MARIWQIRLLFSCYAAIHIGNNIIPENDGSEEDENENTKGSTVRTDGKGV